MDFENSKKNKAEMNAEFSVQVLSYKLNTSFEK